MDKILKNSTTAKGMNFDLNGIQSPAKAAVSAVAEPKVSSKSVFTSAYLKKTVNDENVPPSNFNQLPFKENLVPEKQSPPKSLTPELQVEMQKSSETIRKKSPVKK